MILCTGTAVGQDTVTAARLKADSLLSAARDQFGKGAYESSRQLAGNAYRILSREDDHGGMGEALILLGNIDLRMGNQSSALRNFFTALREYEWMGNSMEQAETAKAIGDIFQSAGLNEKAIEYYNKALDLGGSLMSEEQRLNLEELVARTYLDLGKYDDALRLFIHLDSAYQNKGNARLQESVLNQITICLYSLERYDEAISYNSRALELSRRQGDRNAEMAALNNLGYTYKYLGNAELALTYFKDAADLGVKIDAPMEEVTVTLTNIAVIYQNRDNIKDALAYFFQAEKLAAHAGDIRELARIKHLIASTYYINKDYYNAQLYNRESLRLAVLAGDIELQKSGYLTASNIAAALYDYETSMQEYHHYLDIRDSLQLKKQVEDQNLSQQQYLVERTEKQLDQVIYTRQMERMELTQLRLESEKKEQEVELLRKTNDLQDATIKNQELEKNRALQELLLAEEKLATERKDREIKDLKVQQQLQESELRRSQLEAEKQQQEIQVLTQEKEIADLNLKRVRARTRFLAGIVLLAIISLILIIRSWRYTRKTNRTLSNQRNKIQQQKEAIESQYDIIKVEREKSEKLLLNILPEETAAELKEKGQASPRHYEIVTVLFTDFVGFTMVSEKMSPQEIVKELDYCFLEFDRIIDKYNLEKIKTIGDSYMCAGGIPVANESNPVDVVNAGLEIRDFMEKERELREARGEKYWRLRIGINTGPVVAGVVGKNKFAYDIWGDAVNTASRMESSGEAGKVNISGGTYQIVKDLFQCSYRGKVKAKNKGEIDMYFVEGLKQVNKE